MDKKFIFKNKQTKIKIKYCWHVTHFPWPPIVTFVHNYPINYDKYKCAKHFHYQMSMIVPEVKHSKITAAGNTVPYYTVTALVPTQK